MKSSNILILSLIFLLFIPQAWSEEKTKIIDVGISLFTNRTIKNIEPGSPAAKSRLLPGDRIVFIDGLQTAEMSTDSILKKLTGPEKTVVVLTIEREGKRYTCKIDRTSTDTAVAAVKKDGTQAKPDYSKITTPVIEISRNSIYSENARQDVLSALSLIPKQIRDDMNGWGLKVKIVPSIVDDDRSLSIDKPRGYTHGGGYDNCPGMYTHKKVILIPERVSWKNSPMGPNWQIKSTMLHEMGHAYDHFRSCSTSPEFEAAYEKDSVVIPNEGRRKWEYYLQADGGGQSECFAELFAYSMSDDKKRSAGINQAFPKCFSYINKLVNYSK